MRFLVMDLEMAVGKGQRKTAMVRSFKGERLIDEVAYETAAP
jgi:hypothetical protein